MKKQVIPANAKILTGQETPEKIAQWENDKVNNPEGIYALKSGDHKAYFRNPTRHDVNAALTKASTDATLDMFEELADITFLGGSEAVLSNDTKFLGLSQFMKGKMEGEKCEAVDL